MAGKGRDAADTIAAKGQELSTLGSFGEDALWTS